MEEKENEDIIAHLHDEENIYLIENKEREEKDKTKRLEKIFNRLHSILTTSKRKSFDEIYKKYYFPEDDILKREMIQNITKCKKVVFYILIFYIGAFSISATFFAFSIQNSLLDLLKTSVKIYLGYNNENNTDYRPLKFHEYYYNQTYSEALNLNINLFSILNTIGNIPLKAWGFNISYFFFSCFSAISFLMLYYIGNDEKELLNPKISTFDLLYTLLAYIFLLFGSGCSSLMSQQIIIEYYFKFQKALKQNKNKIMGEQNKETDILNSFENDNQSIINSLNVKLNEKDFEKKEENPINIMFIFLFFGFLNVFGFYFSYGNKIMSIGKGI